MFRFSTKELSSASNEVVRDDNQKSDHDEGLEVAIRQWGLSVFGALTCFDPPAA
jgi:hypothetical protein